MSMYEASSLVQKKYTNNSFSYEQLKKNMYQRRYILTVISLLKTMIYGKK